MSKSDVFPVGGIASCGSCAALRKVYLIAVHDDLRGVGSSSIVFVSPNPEGCEERFQSCFAGAGGRCSCHIPLAPPKAIPTFGLGSGVSGLSCSDEQDKRHKAEIKNDKMRMFCIFFSLFFNLGTGRGEFPRPVYVIFHLSLAIA